MKEMQPDEIAPGEPEPSGGATGIFGVVTTPAASGPELNVGKEEPVAAGSSSPEVQTSTIKMREVVFKATDHATFEDTDALRRILNPTQAATIVPVAPAVDDSGAGGFTQLLRAMSPHLAAPVAAPVIPAEVSAGAVKDHPVAAPARTEAASAPLPPPPAPGMSQPGPVTATGGGDSFTQMFAVPAAPAAASAPAVTPAAPAVPEVEAAPLQNVGFTQLFQSFKVQPGVPVSPVMVAPLAGPPAVPAAASGSGGVPLQVGPIASKEERASGAVDAVFSQPVSIPELAREILHEGDPSAPAPAVEAPASGVPVSGFETRPQPVGSFTQLFQTLAKPGGPTVPEPVKATTAPSSGDPGSFTQLFSSLGSRPPAQVTQADAFPPLNPSSPPSRGGFGGGGLGAQAPPETYPAPSYREPAYREPRPSEPVFSTPPPASSPAAEGGGEMTRLLRRLDGASQGQAALPPLKAEPLPVANPAPAVSRPAEGATVAFRIPEASAASYRAPSPEPPGNTGAAGMTSILNASALRESLRRGGGSEASATPSATQPAAPASGGGGAFPAMPGYPAMPPMPAPSMQMPPAQPQPMPPQMPAMPQMQIPPVPQPQLPKADGAAPVGGGKTWVPLLLIVIIVLLVGILLAVVLLMKN